MRLQPHASGPSCLMPGFAFLKDLSPDIRYQIITLYRLAGWWQDGLDNDALLDRLVAGSHCFIVAISDDRIIGMGRAISDGASDAYIQDVTVHPDFRRRGLGSAIILRLTQALTASGIRWIGLIAKPGTLKMYTGCGFLPLSGATAMLKTVMPING